ncbi:MAG: hypothetical protein NWE98_07640 [Candidatus Bathyarchaeota archaeon]|nr:hypothetical protein [Candidatus Bathyarchaeota archaeon]
MIAIFLAIGSAAIRTGIQIPNLDAVGVSTGLVIVVAGKVWHNNTPKAKSYRTATSRYRDLAIIRPS